MWNIINKRNRNRFIDTQTVRREEVGRLGEKGEGITKTKHKKTKKLIDTDNGMVITRGKWGRGR